jgi:hypothetical protein
MGKIKTRPPLPRGKIPQPSVPLDSGLTFSFKHLDLTGDADFSLMHRKEGYTAVLLERLRAISGMKLEEFRNNRGLRSHVIDWSRTQRPEGFNHLNEQLRDLPAWQFQLTSNEHGRVHGFLVEEVFYVVWLDPDHRLYR